MGLGTDHRLSLAQNPVLLAGQIAILLISSNRNVARLRKRRQIARREEVVAHEAMRQNLDAGKLCHAPKSFDEARFLLVNQEERAVNRREKRPQTLASHLVQRRLGPLPIGQRWKIYRCRDNF